jgi:hypothetical protein
MSQAIIANTYYLINKNCLFNQLNKLMPEIIQNDLNKLINILHLEKDGSLEPSNQEKKLAKLITKKVLSDKYLIVVVELYHDEEKNRISFVNMIDDDGNGYASFPIKNSFGLYNPFGVLFYRAISECPKTKIKYPTLSRINSR